MLLPTKNSHIPYDLDIEPAIISYDPVLCDTVPCAYLQCLTVTIHPKALLCEMQPVTIQSFRAALENICIPRDKLDAQRDVNTLLTEFESLFSKGDLT